MRRPLAAAAGVALLLLDLNSALALAILMPLDERLRSSAFIGLVDVSATVPQPRVPSPRHSDTTFLQIALGRVVQTVKGPLRPDDAIEIDFDNGFRCPNVDYEPGQRYLVFLARDANGRYSTVNYEAGRYKVEHGRVDGMAVELQDRLAVQEALDKLATMTHTKRDA